MGVLIHVGIKKIRERIKELREGSHGAPDSHLKELTAYVLGELSDEETTLVDIKIHNEPTVKAEAEDLRTLSDLISSELKSGRDLSLSSNQRDSILNTVSKITLEPTHVPPPTKTTSALELNPRPMTVLPQRLETNEEGLTPHVWGRFEFLFVFLLLIAAGLFSPQIFSLKRRARASVRGGLDAEAPPLDQDSEGPGIFSLSSIEPAQLKATLVSAAVGLAYYSLVRLVFYPKKAMPVVHAFVTVLISFLCQVMIFKMVRNGVLEW